MLFYTAMAILAITYILIGLICVRKITGSVVMMLGHNRPLMIWVYFISGILLWPLGPFALIPIAYLDDWIFSKISRKIKEFRNNQKKNKPIKRSGKSVFVQDNDIASLYAHVPNIHKVRESAMHKNIDTSKFDPMGRQGS